MSKLIELPMQPPHTGRLIYFYCPGCKHGHAFEVPRWEFNGNFERPSFAPSLRVFYTRPKDNQQVTLCHLFLRDGQIEYCVDSPHELAGKTVSLHDWPPDYHKPGDP